MNNQSIPVEHLRGESLREFSDLGFSVVAKTCERSVEFKIFSLRSPPHDSMSSYVLRHFQRTGQRHMTSTLKSVLTPRLHSTLKWDGCSYWHYQGYDDPNVSGSSGERAQALERFDKVVARCRDWAAELCPQWARMHQRAS